MRSSGIVALASILPGARAGADGLEVGRASVEITPVVATRCAPGSGERLVEAATRLLIALKAEGRGEAKTDR